MSKAPWLIGTLVAVTAAGAAGFVGGRHEPPIAALTSLANLLPAGWKAAQPAKPEGTGPVVYYRDPARPSYSAEPQVTAGGRPYVAVHAGEDIRFDDDDSPLVDQIAPPATASSAPSAAGQRRVKLYRNPMGLPDTSLVPKKDSMGMDYIPVYAGEDDDNPTVKISPGKLQRTGVRSEAAAMRTFSTPIRAPGTVQLDERRQSVISLRFDAWIDKVENVTTGTVVRQGQPLMHVYGPELLGPAAQYMSVGGSRLDSSGNGARRRLENLGVPDAVIAEIDRTHTVPLSFPWPAPRSGIVVERTAIEGMKAAAGESLFRLADISVVWVLADIAESDLPLIGIGQSVAVRTRGRPDRTFTGRIAIIYPSINKSTRTARVRIELPNPDSILLPNMYADVEIATGSARPVLAVPATAVIDSGDRQVVILDKGEGRFEPKDVQVGQRGQGYVELRKGLAAGDQVVVGANFLIDSESNLKAGLQGLKAPEISQ